MYISLFFVASGKIIVFTYIRHISYDIFQKKPKIFTNFEILRFWGFVRQGKCQSYAGLVKLNVGQSAPDLEKRTPTIA